MAGARTQMQNKWLLQLLRHDELKPEQVSLGRQRWQRLSVIQPTLPDRTTASTVDPEHQPSSVRVLANRGCAPYVVFTTTVRCRIVTPLKIGRCHSPGNNRLAITANNSTSLPPFQFLNAPSRATMGQCCDAPWICINCPSAS